MPTALASATEPTTHSRSLTTYAAVVIGFMVVVILEGAVVRATGSGAGCGNHWPLCNGDVIPHHPRLATIIEFVHRQLTTVCTLLVAALIFLTFRTKPSGHRARRAAIWCGILLLTEAFLGAVLVKGGFVESNASDMRVFMQCIHFTNTMLLLAAMTLVWWWLADRQPLPAFDRRAHTVAWTALAITVVVGATGSVAALADTLFPAASLRAGLLQDFASTSPLMVRMRWLHPAAAVIALACALWLAAALRRKGSSLGSWVLALIALQIILGVGDVLLLAPTWMQVLHLLGADLYWIALVATCAGILRPQQA